jgi:uncharacterized OsmC-like protein
MAGTLGGRHEGDTLMAKVNVNEIQTPLRAQYKSSPQAARITDHARTIGTDPLDPFHSIVEPMPGCGAALPVGVHRAIGGMHDAPTPGDILCAALAACQNSAVRMVANLLGVELEFLSVEVTGDVDVRGTMAIDKQVPVGFQSMRCEVWLRAKEGTNPQLLEKLKIAAERCCVVQQTLRNPPRVETTFDISRVQG